MKISEAKALLASIEESKSQYLASRETETIQVIRDALEKSAGMLASIDKNYESLSEIKGLVTNIVDFAITFADGISKSARELTAETECIISKVRELRAEIVKRENKVKEDRISLESEKKMLKEAQEALSKAQKKLASDQSALKQAYQEIYTKKL